MNKEEAIRKTYSRPRYNKSYIPSMVSWDRVMKAMDFYADSKVNLIISNADEIRSMSDLELRNKMLELLYNNGVDAIVDYVKGNENKLKTKKS